jgi:HK97 family phage prohead protease
MTITTGREALTARSYETSFELREVETDGRNLEGMAVPFDVWADLGWFREQHAPTSLKRSTDRQPQLPLLLFHDNRRFSVGHAVKWTHDASGLVGVWRLNSSRDAKDAADQIRDGDLNGLSIGFQPLKSEWDFAKDWNPDLGSEHKDSVRRIESRLVEVSLTATPAFAEAQVTALRHFAQLEAERQRSTTPRLDAWRAYREEVRSAH